MSRHSPVIPINGKMYRHFAIATVLITGCLAMFASGENREALSDAIESQQQKAEVQQVAAKKGLGKKGNLSDNRKVKGSFGADTDYHWRPPPLAGDGSGFAETDEAELVAASNVTFTDNAAAPSGPQTIAGNLPPGMSPAEYAQMANQKKKKKPPPARRAMTAQEIEAIMAASDARSRTPQG